MLAPHVQEARPVHPEEPPVAVAGGEIDAQRVEIDRHGPRRLDDVGVDQRAAVGAANLPRMPPSTVLKYWPRPLSGPSPAKSR